MGIYPDRPTTARRSNHRRRVAGTEPTWAGAIPHVSPARPPRLPLCIGTHGSAVQRLGPQTGIGSVWVGGSGGGTRGTSRFRPGRCGRTMWVR
jgi:hypothetical protein